MKSVTIDDKHYIMVELSEYDHMIDEIHFLNCLRNAGVDNWCGYDEAIDMLNEEEDFE